MDGLTLALLLILAVIIGRSWQWHRDRTARKLAHHLDQANAAMDEITRKRRDAETKIRRMKGDKE
ncbi:hypothetical protein ACFXPN_45815 [Streptomyces griseorubiginosus]|uniref:hypothetical protein n=1 Tax=Streptomyces griseorubiginosus TaxID=67304 RepID=UPI003693D838